MERNDQRQRFEDTIQVAVVVCTITLGVVIFKDKISRTWDDDGLTIVFIALAFITMTYWLGAYFLATRKELSILADRFTQDERMRLRIEDPPIPLAILFGISFGASIAFVWNPMVFIALVVVIQLLDLIGVSYINHKVAAFIKEAIWSDNVRDDFLKCIYQYYIVRPQVFRCTMLLLCYLGSLTILLISARLNGQKTWTLTPEWDNQLTVQVAYLVFIATFIIGRIPIILWRRQRDEEIRRLRGR